MEYRRRHDRRQPRGWFSLFVRLGGWTCLIFGVLLFVLTLFSAGLLFVANQMDRDGKFARAVVKDKRIAIGVDSEGDETREYFVTFRYKSSEGGQNTEAEVDRDLYEALAAEDEHVIRYLKTAPGRIETDIGSYRRSGNLVRNVGLGVGVIGLALLWFFGNRANRAVKIRRDGEKRMAEVTGISPANVEVNGERQARLQWREQDGQTGTSLMRNMGELSRLYQAGDRIVVFRLRDEAFWEGDVGPPWREVSSYKDGGAGSES